MHSSKEQQKQQAENPMGSEIAQFMLGSLFGPAAHMAMEAAQVASTLYTDRFEAAADNRPANRTNGHEGGFKLGAKHSLGGSFGRAMAATAKNDAPDMMVPYWKRDAGPRPRLAA